MVLLGVLVAFAHNAVAAIGGSVLAHYYEAIYQVYYGYLANIAINSATGTLSKNCVTKTGGACTLEDFLKTIISEYSA